MNILFWMVYVRFHGAIMDTVYPQLQGTDWRAGETGAGETGSDSYRCEDARNGWTGFCGTGSRDVSDAVIVILTGYDSFAYAQKAISIGVEGISAQADGL